MAFEHTSVLLKETVESVFTKTDGKYVDCTFGGGGHSGFLLEKLSEEAKLIAFDQDEIAYQNALNKFANDQRIIFFRKNFVHIEKTLTEAGLLPVTGIMFDLGVSSPQLDEAERGFSYMNDAPLDMRMDRTAGLSAAEIVNTWGEIEITKVIRDYSEEKWASRISKFIVEARKEKEIKTTGQLVDIIKAAVPAAARREGPHPAKRTFQALRIAVNRELDVLAEALEQAVRCLEPGGRLAVITFHSLEDRIVKDKIVNWLGKCTCPPGFPVCTCGAQAQVKQITKKPIIPSDEEIESNPRARSAKLRVVEKI